MNTPTEKVIEEILNERLRQIEVEGYSVEQDDKYNEGQLISAATAYSTYASRRAMGLSHGHSLRIARMDWPWAEEYFKPRQDDLKRNLVISAALLAAEMERLNRTKTTV